MLDYTKCVEKIDLIYNESLKNNKKSKVAKNDVDEKLHIVAEFVEYILTKAKRFAKQGLKFVEFEMLSYKYLNNKDSYLLKKYNKNEYESITNYNYAVGYIFILKDINNKKVVYQENSINANNVFGIGVDISKLINCIWDLSGALFSQNDKGEFIIPQSIIKGVNVVFEEIKHKDFITTRIAITLN